MKKSSNKFICSIITKSAKKSFRYLFVSAKRKRKSKKLAHKRARSNNKININNINNFELDKFKNISLRDII